MFKIPPLGSRILVATRYNLPWLNFPRPPIEGTVSHGNPWDQPGTFRLTGVDNCLKESVIPMERVTGITVLRGPEESSEGVSGGQSVLSEPRSYEVLGSKGDLYNVIIRGDQSSCDCMAGARGLVCRHIKEVRARPPQS